MAKCKICKEEIIEYDEWLVEIYKPTMLRHPFGDKGCVHLKCLTK